MRSRNIVVNTICTGLSTGEREFVCVPASSYVSMRGYLAGVAMR